MAWWEVPPLRGGRGVYGSDQRDVLDDADESGVLRILRVKLAKRVDVPVIDHFVVVVVADIVDVAQFVEVDGHVAQDFRIDALHAVIEGFVSDDGEVIVESGIVQIRSRVVIHAAHVDSVEHLTGFNRVVFHDLCSDCRGFRGRLMTAINHHAPSILSIIG